MRMFGICIVLALAVSACAQDARTVTEPKIPVACAVLTAELAPHHGELSDAEERGHRDNARIEQAMANCAPGKAVVLRTGKGERTVFLIAPMKLHADVTLVVEANVGVIRAITMSRRALVAWWRKSAGLGASRCCWLKTRRIAA